MNARIDGAPSFCHIHVELEPGETASVQPVVVPGLADWPSMQAGRVELGLLKRGLRGWQWQARAQGHARTIPEVEGPACTGVAPSSQCMRGIVRPGQVL